MEVAAWNLIMEMVMRKICKAKFPKIRLIYIRVIDPLSIFIKNMSYSMTNEVKLCREDKRIGKEVQ